MKKEFTNKYQKGRHGSTPGKFITRYISRMNAAEPITTLNVDIDPATELQFKMRYLNRNGLAQNSIEQYDDAKNYINKVKQHESLDGKAFGNTGVSYSNRETRDTAKKVQSLYDEGHSVSKLVFSFSHDYMKRHHMVDDEYRNTGHGSLRGHVDQLRVREAIQAGMEALTTSGDYTNPIWVATVHTNTDDLHVHCVLVDDVDLEDSKRLVRSEDIPQDYGYVNDTQSKKFRKAVDLKFRELDTMQTLKQEQPSDELNLDTAKKKIEFSHYKLNNTLQKLTASLPKDAEKWDTYAEPELMKRPNEWLETYITEIMTNYPKRSGWDNLQPVIEQRLQQIPEEQRLPYRDYMQDTLYRLSEGYILDDIRDSLEYQPLTEHNMYLTQQAVDNDDPQEMQAAFDLNTQENNAGFSLSLRHLVQYQKRKKDHEKWAKIMNEQIHLFDLDHRQDADFTQESPIRNWYKVHGQVERARVDKYRYMLKAQDGIPLNNIPELRRDRDDLQRRHDYIDKLAVLEIPEKENVSDAVVHALDNCDDKVQVLEFKDLINKAYNGESMTREEARQLDNFGGKDSEMIGSKAYYAQHPEMFRTDLFEYATQYAMDNEAYSMRCWEQGAVHGDEVTDAYTYMQHLMAGQNDQPAQPRLFNEVYTREYFDTVKGSDLHDMLHDFSANQSRDLSDSTISTYDKTISAELSADLLADNYLAQRNQANDYITDSLNSTRQYREFADVIKDQRSLPKAAEITTAEMLPETLAEKRNLAAMNLADADFDTNKHLQLIKNVSEEYRAMLLEEIRETSYDIPEEYVHDDAPKLPVDDGLDGPK